MADKKISALTGASTPLAGTEVLPIVQSGATVKVAVSDLTAGRAISATQVTVSTGNVVIGTSGQGIDFSATPGTGTSELLADYEEGTWTPNQGAGLTVIGTFSSSGTYTKIGREVTVTILLSGSTSIAVATQGILLTNLPFAALGSLYLGLVTDNSAVVQTGCGVLTTASTNTLYALETRTATPNIFAQITYFV
jgi:hypothetical protein